MERHNHSTFMESGHLDLFGVPVWLLVFASLAALHATGTYLIRRGVVLAASPLAEDPVLAGHFLPQVIEPSCPTYACSA